MTAEELSALSATDAAELPHLLHALWLDAHGDWHAAHEIAQSAEPNDAAKGAWLHGYLHRKEGDSFNASYWYSKAGKPVCSAPFEEEWQIIATAFIES